MSIDGSGWGMAVSDDGELLSELFRRVDQRLGRMVNGYDRIAAELHGANLIQYYRMHLEQLDRAIDDPSLAAALSTVQDVTPQKRRQLLFANKQYTLLMLGHMAGFTSRSELLGALRVLSRNPVFREYWERTGRQRRDLPEESLEARSGRAVDVIMAERFDEVEEWWVEGSPRPEG
ncbi:DUF6082 family protein [Streptomyces canus]|uniref:DUF6082 family protein n=1 Tax=Streptomyces canus TaxID=58343 RepID=UPI0036E56FA9